jgi:hypothetical protein
MAKHNDSLWFARRYLSHNGDCKMNSNYLIIVIGVVYFGIGITQLFKGSVPNFIIYTGYAFSNIGLFMLAK